MDDEPAFLEVLARFLEDDFEVATTGDPVEAFDLVQTRRFDLCLYDVCMDPMPGLELLVLTLSASAGTPVLLMTGAPTVERAVEALRAGATDFLLKPLRFESLKDTLFEALRKARRAPLRLADLASTHEALRRAVEAKDPTTSGHAERVQGVCRLVGSAMGLSEEDAVILERAALLHDVGKIGVPDAVLGKPGRLTEAEFALIRRHPEMGARILEPLPELAAVRDCVLFHHERWDGKGYPYGLRGEEVSLAGRVLVLAEVFDALAHRRSYKEAWPRHDIRAYFEQAAGRHFDPELTACFLDLLDRDFDALTRPAAAVVQEQGLERGA